MSSSTSNTPTIAPRQAMLGYTSQLLDIVHLPGGRHIVVCSEDGSLRLWDLESDAQIGDVWRDEGHKAEAKKIALSPNGKTIASGSDSGTVRLWDVETRKTIAKWVGHTENVGSVCWSGDGERVVSGSWDGTARVWDIKTGKTVLEIKNGHQYVWAVTYSPDNTKFATGGENENAVKIWDANTGKLLSTLKQDQSVRSLAWSSDGKKLISGSLGPIGIFDTVTWEQIATLKGHIFNLTLSPNGRFLATTSIWDETVCLWNLNTNLPVCPLLQHEKDVSCLAFSADGKLLVTACEDKNVYLWDINAILKDAGLEDLLSIPSAPVTSGELLKNSDATRHPAQPKKANRVPPGFFDDIRGNIHSSTSYGVHPSSDRRSHCALTPSISPVLLGRLPLLFRRSHSHTSESTEIQQRSRKPTLFRHGPLTIQVAAVRDKQALFVARRPEYEKAKQMQLQKTQSQGQVQVLSLQTQPTDASTSEKPPATGAATVQSQPLSLLARLVLLICCASPPDADCH